MPKALNLLLIDDEEEFCTTLADRLELRGMNVRVATCGSTGLQALEAEVPDIVLLDMRMPGLSGVEVLQRIRAAYHTLAVIIITGHCSEHDYDKAQSLKVQGYLAKPLNFEELLNIINKLPCAAT